MNASIEQRKYNRHKVFEDATVITPYSIGEIVDVSSGGMSLKCHDHIPFSKEFHLDILAGNNNYYELQIPVKIVWEESSTKSPLPITSLKKFGVEFGQITASQKAQLDNLIEK